MKPMRGLPKSWLSQMPRERRNAMVALLLLAGSLGSLVMYQRSLLGGGPPRPPVADGAGAGTERPAGAPAGAEANGTGAGANPAAAGQSAGAAGPQITQVPAPTKLLPPLSGPLKVLHAYGFEKSRLYGDFRLFPGTDYAAGKGEAVRAAADGKVISVEDDPVWGRTLTLDNGGGMLTRYAGVGRVNVAEGAQVKAGETIAEVGDNGSTSGAATPHLYFEVQLNGEPIDPASYFSE